MIKNKILKAFFLAAIFGGVMLFAPEVASAATCYTETGPLQVEPDTRSCPAPGQSATSPPFSTYREQDGTTINNPLSGANVNNCYYLSTESGGTGIFVRAGCADLESLRHNAARVRCEASGGSYSSVGATAGECGNCPAGMISGGPVCEASDPGGGGGGGGGAGAIADEDGGKIIEWVQLVINVLTGLAGLAITAAVIVGGIQYSTSGGNPQAASAAKKRITNALLALLAMVFLYSFLQWIVPGGAF